MATIGRPGLLPKQQQDLWRRWKAGGTIIGIGLALGKAPGSIHGVLSLQGGIAPEARSRSVKVLTLTDREEISRGVTAGKSAH